MLTQRTWRRTAPCLFCSRVKMSSGKSLTPEKTGQQRIPSSYSVSGCVNINFSICRKKKNTGYIFQTNVTHFLFWGISLWDAVAMVPSGKQIFTGMNRTTDGRLLIRRSFWEGRHFEQLQMHTASNHKFSSQFPSNWIPLKGLYLRVEMWEFGEIKSERDWISDRPGLTGNILGNFKFNTSIKTRILMWICLAHIVAVLSHQIWKCCHSGYLLFACWFPS